MHKLAILTLAAASALSSGALAQTVSPADRYEGTPEVPLKKPATAAQAGKAPAPIAQPTAPAAPTPPAGITWRNQAAPAPSMAPVGPSAAPQPIVTQRTVTPPPPMMVSPARRAEAVPPPLPIPPRASQLPPPPRSFVIRRQGGSTGEGPAQFEIRSEMDEHMADGPARVIVRRHREGPMVHGPDRVIVRRRMGDLRDHPGEWDREDVDGPMYEDHRGDEGEHGWDDRDVTYPVGHPGGGHGYASGPCCSGGMITETITTTTTYPPTVEERVVHHETRSHPPRRLYKRKLRGR
ncbi:MAG TPA: hypothetical protein VF631_11310 [Allosphingosinicella sp.]|uniref:hypothetical protein n=1 Tax=Allosphingosinicella sp. TaxID=2823234 RepID=UPI002F27EF28